MRKAFIITSLIASVCLAAGACANAGPASRQIDAAGAQEAALPNVLVQAEGEVSLRRLGWVDFIPVGFGTVVSPGDLLRVEAGGQAAVFCGAAGEWSKGAAVVAPDGSEHGVPCAAGRPARPWSDVAALRAEAAPELPYILSPRNSSLLNPRPELSWHAPTEASGFTVTLVSDDGQTRPAVQAGEARISWPENWPPLEPESSYVLVVESGGKRSDSGPQGNTGLGFWLLGEKEAAAVREQEGRLRSAGLSPAAANLLVAELYMRAGLRAEAARLYQELDQDQVWPAVQVALGQVWLEMGIPEEARQAFGQGLAAAQQTSQSEVEAAAWVGQALALRALNDTAAAQEALQSAYQVYTKIGDQNGAAEVKKLLESQ